ncbi:MULTISPECIES: hypothetical protein [unclassified Bacillus (in: firmicutes)]|uniref:hypothetical protein n=1 Tax=unclassified Bacillus (in: firmicutes) TaxID=185979 RepID=UPI001BE4EC48|nr:MULTISPECIES: hypothetical protein [unclassified Bacillus (in: firmicutes)]MBT2617451.1 hypothetical protein [Bacillus sp. ISL-78]MBT2630857.1 hypothetical protein [Bacillus sp. ISL-101]
MVYVATLFYSPNLLELLFYSGNIYSALLAPILVIVFSKGKVDDYIPISAVLAIVASYIIQPHVSEFQSIWFSGLASLTILVICTILSLIKNKWRIVKTKP